MFKKILCTTALITAVSFGPAVAGHHEGHEHDKKMDHKEKMADKPNLVDIAVGDENFSTLVAALKAAGLVETLKDAEKITVFAPTNEAFAKLPEGTVKTLLMPENKEKLQSILKYHVVGQKVKGKYLLDGTTTVDTLEGGTVTITKDEAGAKINDANIVKTDIKGSNGIIHVIDTVIMPAE